MEDCPIFKDRIEKILPTVEKPTRYLGGEWGAPPRPWLEAEFHVALAYPDLYEVGQSHLGLRILYGLINSLPGYLAERVYAPWPDMEEALRRESLPLFSLETWRPVRDFELLGFTLPYELTYTNILNILDLSGLPLTAGERLDSHPLVLGGGPGAFNPEPLAEYFDLFLLGEAEEALPEMLAAMRAARSARLSRPEILRVLAGIDGVYVPSLYQVSYHPGGQVAGIIADSGSGAPLPVRKRITPALDSAYFPASMVVPHQEIVHDRGMLEIMRGCTHGCRFCQAGMIYRPVRHRSPSVLREQLARLAKATGYEEFSLTSLSSTDHPQIGEILRRMLADYGSRGINISLPSLRADRFSLELAAAMQGSRKAGLTFAPEAGSDRLRRVINKDLTEEDILNTAEAAFTGGWQRLKLYFMIGLPTESEDDLAALAGLVRRIMAIGRRHGGRAQITVSISTFVPKPHTPFQWRPQIGLEETRAKQAVLQKSLRGRGLELQWHQAEQSLIEGVFARGDRRLGRVLRHAFAMGARFDGWREWFDFARWERAFAAADLDPAFYLHRHRSYQEILPWDHLDAGVSKSFLISQDRLAAEGLISRDCRQGPCHACGACPIPAPDRVRP